MKDYVTFETALKLKEAGFPQPKVLPFGQMAYFCIKYPESIILIDHIDGGPIADDAIYAPRATDILLHLPEGCILMMETQEGYTNPMCYVFPPADWMYEDERKYIGPEGNENPAEAAAQMWLKLNKK